MCLSGHRKYPFGAHDAAVRERSLEIMKKAVDFAAQTGISIIQLAGYDVYYESGDEQTRGWFVENLQRAVEFAAASGVVLAFETMETPFFMDTVAKAMSYVRKVNSPWLGIYPDIRNLQNAAVLYGHNVTDDLASGTGHIFAMHLKETKPGVYRDMAFGTGRTPYDACLRIAKQQGVRMFTGEFWHQPDETDYETMIAAAFTAASSCYNKRGCCLREAAPFSDLAVRQIKLCDILIKELIRLFLSFGVRIWQVLQHDADGTEFPVIKLVGKYILVEPDCVNCLNQHGARTRIVIELFEAGAR